MGGKIDQKKPDPPDLRMRIARINERGGASIFAEVRDCLSSSSRDILQSGVARECEGEESVAGIEERRGEKEKAEERREAREEREERSVEDGRRQGTARFSTLC